MFSQINYKFIHKIKEALKKENIDIYWKVSYFHNMDIRVPILVLLTVLKFKKRTI